MRRSRPHTSGGPRPHSRSRCTTPTSARSAGRAAGSRTRLQAASSATSPTAAGSTATPPRASVTPWPASSTTSTSTTFGATRVRAANSPRREGGQTFGSGSRATVAIMLLVKQPGAVPAGGGVISYHDIGDYLSREEKLAAVAETSIDDLPWQRITPNEHHDWLSQRDGRYGRLIPLAGEPGAIFHTASSGLKTNRDTWVYNSSEAALRRNVGAMIGFYNDQLAAFAAEPVELSATRAQRADQAKAFVEKDPARFSWDVGDYQRMANGQRYALREDMIRTSLYRPFCKQVVAFDRIPQQQHIPAAQPLSRARERERRHQHRGSRKHSRSLRDRDERDPRSGGGWRQALEALRPLALPGRTRRTDVAGRSPRRSRLQPQPGGSRPVPRHAGRRPDGRRCLLLRLRHPALS